MLPRPPEMEGGIFLDRQAIGIICWWPGMDGIQEQIFL